jgi:hypothetical protein
MKTSDGRGLFEMIAEHCARESRRFEMHHESKKRKRAAEAALVGSWAAATGREKVK